MNIKKLLENSRHACSIIYFPFLFDKIIGTNSQQHFFKSFISTTDQNVLMKTANENEEIEILVLQTDKHYLIIDYVLFHGQVRDCSNVS